jgi:nucleotide-binding universal stress UspA family protein
VPGIVVGINGSPNSERALGWAMSNAAELQAPLTVLAIHEVPKSYWGNLPVTGPGEPSVLAGLRRAAEEMTERAASQLGDVTPPAVQVKVKSGFPVRELVAASQEADLMIIGAASGSGFSRLVMGSVSHDVVQQAASPVVIVPNR